MVHPRSPLPWTSPQLLFCFFHPHCHALAPRQLLLSPQVPSTGSHSSRRTKLHAVHILMGPNDPDPEKSSKLLRCQPPHLLNRWGGVSLGMPQVPIGSKGEVGKLAELGEPRGVEGPVLITEPQPGTKLCFAVPSNHSSLIFATQTIRAGRRPQE